MPRVDTYLLPSFFLLLTSYFLMVAVTHPVPNPPIKKYNNDLSYLLKRVVTHPVPTKMMLYVAQIMSYTSLWHGVRHHTFA